MRSDQKINTVCVHAGALKDDKFGGAVSPIYVSSAYGFVDSGFSRYPRYFTSPNQIGLAQKIAKLEGAEAGLIFGSGMAAISSTLLALLKSGDHIVVQRNLYGGSTNFIRQEFTNYGISYDFAINTDVSEFRKLINDRTKGIFIETPSNPLLKIVDLEAISSLAKEHGLWTFIDNTFPTPINQRPIDFGIDIVMHSASKYLGGHSDIIAGAIAGSFETIEIIRNLALNLGSSLSDSTVWLLERSMKTLVIRVEKQSQNASLMAHFLDRQPWVKKVFYPGLKNHVGHQIAVKQMKNFGAMLSVDLVENIDIIKFFKSLKLFKPVVSLGGVESTVSSPKMTSHSLLSDRERTEQEITDQLVRVSMGIEHIEDLKRDFSEAIKLSIN